MKVDVEMAVVASSGVMYLDVEMVVGRWW
jgi:hypothetical protein